jgi:hypothetical protein
MEPRERVLPRGSPFFNARKCFAHRIDSHEDRSLRCISARRLHAWPDAAQLCGAAFGLTFDMDYCNVATYDRMRETHGLANVSGIELTDDG